jgi:hypothetical protein
MLIIEKRIVRQDAFDAKLVLAFELRQKRRLRANAGAGEDLDNLISDKPQLPEAGDRGALGRPRAHSASWVRPSSHLTGSQNEPAEIHP